MKKICVDARLWGTRHTGIGRYIENLLDNLPQYPNVRISIIIPPDLSAEPKLQKFDRYYAKYHPYSLLSQIEMLWLLLLIRPHLLHVTHFTIPILWPGKLVVTIHDLIKHQSRGIATTTRSPYLYWVKYIGYLLLVRLAVYRASYVIVPAEYWKQDIIKRFHLSASKVAVTYESVDQSKFAFAPTSQPSSYVIYTGNVYPHKNLPVLLRAVKLLNGRIKLVIVCARTVFSGRLTHLIEELNISALVAFKSNISDAELTDLLSHALAFVTPSLIEGFGLPGLEAMSAGTPVIAARASCLPEIYGPGALYFDAASPSDLAKQILQLSHSPALRKQMVNYGHLQVDKYSWKQMAAQTWQIYQNALL